MRIQADSWTSFILYRSTSSLNLPSKPNPQVPGHQEVELARELSFPARLPAGGGGGGRVGIPSPPPVFRAMGFCPQAARDDRHVQSADLFMALGPGGAEGRCPGSRCLPCRHPGFAPTCHVLWKRGWTEVEAELLACAPHHDKCPTGHLRSPHERTPGGRDQDWPISQGESTAREGRITDLLSHSWSAGARV